MRAGLLRIPAVLAVVAASLVAGAPAQYRGEATVPADRKGVHLLGVSFFTAAFTELVETEGEKSARIKFGDLDTVRYRDGILPRLDAQIVVANLTDFSLEEVPVHVKLSMGVAAQSAMPAEVTPGAPGIREELFFERTFFVKGMSPGSLGRVAVSDIRLLEAIAEYSRQGLWPTYIRVEAGLRDLPKEVAVLTPAASSYIRILP